MKRAFASVGIKVADISPETRGRFMAKVAVAKPDECWIWTASRTNQGYGRFMLPGFGCTTAQRVAFVIFHGDLAPGLVIDHLCSNTSCVNPGHLEAVSHRVNILRGNGFAAQHARRDRCLRDHPLALYDGPNHKQRYCPTCKREQGRESMRRRRAAKRLEAAA